MRNSIDLLASSGRNITVAYDKRYVDNGKIITTAGLSSGIDGAFHLVSKMLGPGRAQRTAMTIEYNWDPDSKFGRAAFGDRHLPEFQGFEAETISAEGNAERWEVKTLVSKPASLAEIVDLTQKQIASSTPHVRSSVVVTSRKIHGADQAELEWKFTDDRGRAWRGSEEVEPSQDERGKFVIRIKLIQGYK